MQAVNVNPLLFRAYDIRGIVGEVLDDNVAYTIGLSLGAQALGKGHTHIVVGRDARLSGPSLSKALILGLAHANIEIIDIGIVPTPVLYFACHHLNTQCGVMVTGSHNPAQYNGFKLVMEGKTLSGEAIQKLYASIVSKNDIPQDVTIDDISQYSKISYVDVIPDYINRITSDIKLKRPLKVVVDAGNGAAGHIAPKLFEGLGCEVIPLYCELDGNFPNHHPDPSQESNLIDLQNAILEHKADLGLAFDGDADRLGVVTNNGQIIWPDRQLMVFAKDMLSRKPGASVIYDVKCSRNLASVIEQFGGDAIMCRTGHSFIKEKMYQTSAELGGEMSGHFFFKERWFGFDDGIYAGARMLEILAKESNERTVSEIFQSYPDSINTPEILVKIAETRKFVLIDELIKNADFGDAKIVTIDGLRVEFQEGWGLVRASNTTNSLVLRFEADSQSVLTHIIDLFKQQLKKFEPNIELLF